jgi:hypothetical protein
MTSFLNFISRDMFLRYKILFFFSFYHCQVTSIVH